MSRIFSVLLFLVLLQVSALADGYPFDPETQRVTVPSLRLKLIEEQKLEVAATGTLTFGKEQMSLLRLHYPAITNRVDVVAATHNDNLEERTEKTVDCFWVAPDEVAITLNEKHPKGEPPFPPPTNATFPSDAELKDSNQRFIRLGPDGKIYFRGEVISLDRAFHMVDELARLSKASPDGASSGGGGCLYVTMPPPLSTQEAGYLEADQLTPKQILGALTVYAASKSVGVGPSW